MACPCQQTVALRGTTPTAPLLILFVVGAAAALAIVTLVPKKR